jgi:hypothetical protein
VFNTERFAMADRTYTTGAVREAIRLELGSHGEGMGEDVFSNWKARGYWPLTGHSKGWTRYTVEDAARLLIQAELIRRFGVPLEYASRVAEAKGLEWPRADDDRRYLVFDGLALHLVKASEIADYMHLQHINTGEPLSGVCALVADAVDATGRMAARLAALTER